MDRIFIMLGVAVAFALFQIFVSNPIAQKIMPTKISDGFMQRVRYSVVHRGVLLAILFGVGGILIAFGW